MYIIENSNCCYSEEQIKNYILDMSAFEVLQNIDSAFDEKKSGPMQIDLLIDYNLNFLLFAFYGKANILI